MPATENVEEFLRRWEHLRPKFPTINTIQSASDTDDRQDLTVADVSSVLDELIELREQLSDRIVPVETTDTVVHLQDPPIDYGLPVGSPVRFATGPNEDDYVQVRCDHDGWVRIIGFPELDVRPYGMGNCVRVRPAQT